MRSYLILSVTILMSISCHKKQLDFKVGKFESYVNGSTSTIIERYNGFQFESYPEKQKKRLYKLKWVNDSLYILEPTVKKDSVDFNYLNTKIDSTDSNTIYFTSFKKGVDFRFSSKMIKVGNDVSKEFKEILKKETAR